MSESAEVELCQNASNNDLVENEVQIEAKGDHCSDESGRQLIRPDADHYVEPKTIKCDNKNESETEFGISDTNGTTGISEVSQVDGMRNTDRNATQTPDVCSNSQHTEDGVDGMYDEPTQESLRARISTSSVSALPDSTNEVIIIETIVKTNSNEVTLITDTTVKTTTHSSDECSEQNQSSADPKPDSDSTSDTNEKNLSEPDIKINNKSSDAMITTTTSRPKQLKSLLKKTFKEKSMKISSDRKRVTFSETMQVFCDDWPQSLMPQIIALKSPTDFNLVEVQGYMFEPPVEYQDFLPFEPPPDYRDFINNSLCAFDNDLTINYIDEEDDDENTFKKNEQKFLNEISSKWESMILNNSESLEEEQIIGVLKEDALLQAIGSHIGLPDEQLCPEDFPIHSCVKLAESELSDITSDDGNDSSPTGSLQDIQSDSSITSQDTIILINTDSNDNNDSNEKFEIFSNKNSFNEMQTSFDEEMNSSTNNESDVKCRTESDENSLNEKSNNELNFQTNDSVKCEETNETNIECNGDKEAKEEIDSKPDVAENSNRKDRKEAKTHESETHESDAQISVDKNALECELNNDRKHYNLFTNDENNDCRVDHSNSFKRNLMFYENMFSNNIKSESTLKADKSMKQSHTVSHFIIENNPKYPIITQTVSNNNIENGLSAEIKQMSNEVNNKTINLDNYQSVPTSRASMQQTLQTQPNSNNWSTDEFIIEYTSEPKALVPSKRTASLSNFATATTAHINSNSNSNTHILRNNNNIQYLSLNRNSEIPKQWNAYNIEYANNNSSQIRYPYPPNQRSVSPNPPMVPTNPRPVTSQPVYYQNRPQFNPRYPSTHAMPVQVMYNRMPGPPPNQQKLSLRLPVMSQTLGPPHKHPPPYHYHIQQHSNEFPNPSEIRRRDGLNAYPHVLNQTPQAGALPVPPINHNNSQNINPQSLSKDELEQFVQQDIQRTERIKKRYSLSEEDDPSFGFARRPSVRGIRPKFETTHEILNKMQTQIINNNNPVLNSQMYRNQVSRPQSTSNLTAANSNNNISNNQIPNQQNQSQKKPHIVQIRFQTQNPLPVKYMTEMSDQSSQALHANHVQSLSSTAPQMSRTLPRPSSLMTPSQMNALRTEDGVVIRLAPNTSRDQLKQQIQRQLEQQLHSKMLQKNSSNSSTNLKSVMSSNISSDERGAPEGASSSPKHSSDLLFAKNLNTNNSNSSGKSGETTVNKQTNDTKKLVITSDNNSEGKVSNDTEGVIYYAMNV